MPELQTERPSTTIPITDELLLTPTSDDMIIKIESEDIVMDEANIDTDNTFANQTLEETIQTAAARLGTTFSLTNFADHLSVMNSHRYIRLVTNHPLLSQPSTPDIKSDNLTGRQYNTSNLRKFLKVSLRKNEDGTF